MTDRTDSARAEQQSGYTVQQTAAHFARSVQRVSDRIQRTDYRRSVVDVVALESVQGFLDRIARDDLGVYAAGRAETTTALPRPGDGCQCTWHNEDRGGGHYELVAEYEPACPEHSEHVWNPRTGMWEHRADTTTATTEAEAGARAVSEMGDWFMQQGFDRDVTAAQACYERAARLRGGAR